jgi:hypothetical protein
VPCEPDRRIGGGSDSRNTEPSGKFWGGQEPSGQKSRTSVRTKSAFVGSGLPHHYPGSSSTELATPATSVSKRKQKISAIKIEIRLITEWRIQKCGKKYRRPRCGGNFRPSMSQDFCSPPHTVLIVLPLHGAPRLTTPSQKLNIRD